MARRTFDWVGFWDTSAWVAETLGPYTVSQAKTLPEAVKQLGTQLAMSAMICVSIGEGPWDFLLENRMRTPRVYFDNAAKAEWWVKGSAGDKEKFYRGKVSVEEPTYDSARLKAVKPQRRAR